ncbi:peptidase U32 family protein [Prevotella pectinovora]|uniref:peptidase U32 family protein n=1 Tax=Prevotella pectinovora TaxID=1602169 RepID=UPI0005B69B78|nr:U32 family peptidase [Prevotella pectinovora]KIP62207.1 protease [Prevotella pectinovora]
MRKLELLAPAKDLKCGIAAIDCGADAVYIGAAKFGARQAVGNSIDDINELCEYAHKFGCKVYVTVNTIIYDNELEDTQKLLNELGRIGVDAILVQDMGITKLQLPQNVALHASTQTDNRSAEKVEWLARHNFDRVVLARELSLEEIRNIHRRVPQTELEVFVHGALCVSYSGVCYASEYCFGRSANRGACAQFCRMKFDLTDKDGNEIINQAHLLSLKDMCRIDSLEQLADAGVTSFKIEGRLKDINYVRNVTAAYSNQLNEIISRRGSEYERASSGVCDIRFTPNLNKTFNRGFTDYFLNGRTSDLASFYTPKAMGEYVGKVKEIRGNSFNVAGTTSFANGDGLCFINSNNELEGFRINRAEGNRLFPLRMPRGLRKGIALYRNSDQLFEKELNGDNVQRKLGIRINIKASAEGLHIEAKTCDEKLHINLQKDISLEKAQKSQVDNIKRQISKFGNTIFTVEDVIVEPTDFPWFIPNSILAEIRRQATDELMGRLSEMSENQKDTKTKDQAQQLPDNGKVSFHSISSYQQPYMYNIANRLAHSFYEQEGMSDITPAFEIRKPSSPLVMQCRYCLRHELGQCKKSHKQSGLLKEPLHLRLADGRTFRLEFDCKKCQMNIYADE